MAVLKRITDKAPTNPRDKARDDLTTATIDATPIVTTQSVLPKFTLDENVSANLLYNRRRYSPPANEKIKI